MKKKQQETIEEYIETKITPKKKKTEVLSKYMSHTEGVTEKTVQRVCTCSSYNQYITDKEHMNKKLISSNSCKNRFCPVCAYRKSKKDALMIATIMTAIQEELGYEFLFLTVTTPNVTSSKLQDEIQLFNRSWQRLTQRKIVKDSIEGYVRKLEITRDDKKKITKRMYNRNPDYYDKRGLHVGDKNPNYDTYNPHFHGILAIKKSYFTGKKYITHEQWLDLWRQATRKTGINEDGTDEITSLNIKKIRKGHSVETAVNEIAKYTAKDSDFLKSEEVFQEYYRNLKGRQLITFNRVFKDYRKKYENGELDKYIDKDTTEYVYRIISTWNSEFKQFYQEDKELTEEEKLYFNHKDN